MPEPCIVDRIGPSKVPVKPSMPRTSLTSRAFSRNVRAAHSARRGFAGHQAPFSAMSPGFAPI